MIRKTIHQFSFFSAILSGLFFSMLFSCETKAGGSPEAFPKERKIDSLSSFTISDSLLQEKEKASYKFSYRTDSLVTTKDIDSFRVKYNEEQQKIIYALNRIDAYRVRPGAVLVIPDTLFDDLMIYSPFPENIKVLGSLPRSILVAQRIQAFALYENGELIRWGPVSSGKRSTPTPNGLFYSNYRAKRKISTVNSSWIMPYYINFMNFQGVGSHQYTLPGFPASHACVRLYREDAHFIYHWAEMWILEKDVVVKNGTPFMVFGEYDFDDPFPWRKLAQDSKANNLIDEELEILHSYVEEYKKDARNFRKIEIEKPDELLGM